MLHIGLLRAMEERMGAFGYLCSIHLRTVGGDGYLCARILGAWWVSSALPYSQRSHTFMDVLSAYDGSMVDGHVA